MILCENVMNYINGNGILKSNASTMYGLDCFMLVAVAMSEVQDGATPDLLD